jgi:hypothetical protein
VSSNVIFKKNEKASENILKILGILSKGLWLSLEMNV